jgi:hypothetical protein
MMTWSIDWVVLGYEPGSCGIIWEREVNGSSCANTVLGFLDLRYI